MYIKNMSRDAALEIQHMSVEDKAAEIASGEYVTTAYRVKRHDEDKAAEILNSNSVLDLDENDCGCATEENRVKRHNEDTAAKNSASYEDFDCVCQDHYSHESGESWV